MIALKLTRPEGPADPVILLERLLTRSPGKTQAADAMLRGDVGQSRMSRLVPAFVHCFHHTRASAQQVPGSDLAALMHQYPLMDVIHDSGSPPLRFTQQVRTAAHIVSRDRLHVSSATR